MGPSHELAEQLKNPQSLHRWDTEVSRHFEDPPARISICLRHHAFSREQALTSGFRRACLTG
ncbi:hypothetical protein ASF89_00900 [Frigoribacterium sp. Leaf172]|nr:hypothetical protein ASF89_00900 [Frigoribacterium sp. Leaf172]